MREASLKMINFCGGSAKSALAVCEGRQILIGMRM